MTIRECPTCRDGNPCEAAEGVAETLDAYRLARAEFAASGRSGSFAPMGWADGSSGVFIAYDGRDEGTTSWQDRSETYPIWHRFAILPPCTAGDRGCGLDPCECRVPDFLLDAVGSGPRQHEHAERLMNAMLPGAVR